MTLDPTTKLAKVRDAMAADQWEDAIRLASKLRSLGKYQTAIDRAKDYLNNPEFYRQLGFKREDVMAAWVAALKEKFSKSWAAVKNKKPKPKKAGTDTMDGRENMGLRARKSLKKSGGK